MTMTTQTWRDRHTACTQGQATPTSQARHLERRLHDLEHHNVPLQALSICDVPQVHADAEAAATRFLEDRARPLEGAFVVLEDMIDMQGYPTAAGTWFLGHAPASQDASILARLRDAGAIGLGKAAMSELGLGFTGVNPGHLTPRNPHDPTRACGGSAAGCAAAVASGFGDIGLGVDVGGGVNVPASLCGLVGFAATPGRLPMDGVQALAPTLERPGWMARDVEDVASVASTLLHTPTLDPHLPPLLLDPSLVAHATPNVRAAFDAALAHLGARVESTVLPELAHADAIGWITLLSEASDAQGAWFQKHRDTYNLETQLWLGLGARITAAEYVRAGRLRARLHRALDRALGDGHILVTPTTACPAPTLTDAALDPGHLDQATHSALSHFTMIPALAGLPALTLPIGQVDGTPIGLHMIAARGHDMRLLAAAQAAASRLH